MSDETRQSENTEPADPTDTKGWRPRYDQAGKGYAGGRDETAAWGQTPPAQRDEVRLEEEREDAADEDEGLQGVEGTVERAWQAVKGAVGERADGERADSERPAGP